VDDVELAQRDHPLVRHPLGAHVIEVQQRGEVDPFKAEERRGALDDVARQPLLVVALLQHQPGLRELRPEPRQQLAPRLHFLDVARRGRVFVVVTDLVTVERVAVEQHARDAAPLGLRHREFQGRAVVVRRVDVGEDQPPAPACRSRNGS
jgi:hypothetical protein